MATTAVRIERGRWQTGLDKQLLTAPCVDKIPTSKELEAEHQRTIARLNLDYFRREKEAYRKGFEEGFRAGEADGRSAIQGEQELLCQLTLEIDKSIGQVWDALQQKTAALAVEIARRIIGETIEQQQDLALHITRRLLTSARDSTKVIINVSSADAETLRQAETDLYKVTEGVSSLEIREKASLPRGAVEIQTDFGGFCLDPLQQIEQVAAALEVK